MHRIVVKLGRTLNHQGPRNMNQFSMAVVREGVLYLFHCNMFILVFYDKTWYIC
jgi:hypothetical protein